MTAQELVFDILTLLLLLCHNICILTRKERKKNRIIKVHE